MEKVKITIILTEKEAKNLKHIMYKLTTDEDDEQEIRDQLHTGL